MRTKLAVESFPTLPDRLYATYTAINLDNLTLRSVRDLPSMIHSGALSHQTALYLPT
jgi:hypothetical protein